jgi:hypothetical protein
MTATITKADRRYLLKLLSERVSALNLELSMPPGVLGGIPLTKRGADRRVRCEKALAEAIAMHKKIGGRA